MHVAPASEFLSSLNRIVAFERELFGDDYVYYVEQMVRWAQRDTFFYVHVPHPAFGKDDTLSQPESILAGMSTLVSTRSTLDDLCSGKIRAGKMRDWAPADGQPLLYLNTLLSVKMKYVFPMAKAMLRELKGFTQRHDVKFQSAFSIAVNPLVERHLLRMGFEKVGSYRHRYAILEGKPDKLGWLARL